MSRKIKRNLSASVLARLLQRAREGGDDYQVLLSAFACERFLYRLSAGSSRDRFILKGAMLLRVWSENPYRSTRDLDLLRRGHGDADAICEDIAAICSSAVESDGMEFDPSSRRHEAIRAEDEYGDRNSRIKDFFDLRYLALRFPFERKVLVQAVRQTFSRRKTPVPAEPLGLTAAYWQNPSRPAQVSAFARRAGLVVSPEEGAEILAVLRPFLLPVLADARTERAGEDRWPPGGPWA